LSDTEYLAEIKVKISFISANFRIKTTILETRPPHYLRCEGAGEDSSVASSLKQTTEMFLTERPDGTEIRTRTHAEVFGRLGSFGLSVMKTKADRMWEEFGANLAAILRQDTPAVAAGANATPAANPAPQAPSMQVATPVRDAKPAKGKWWSRLTGSGDRSGDSLRDLRLATDIYFEVHRGGDVIKILWPAHEAKEAAAWLKEIMQG
jgi:carbon monoxide dehydrogenase subunit G